MRRVARLFAVLPLAGCAYFNGIYNAQRAEHRADAMRRSGRTALADSLYQLAAATADSVRVHHPAGHWAARAELIAGWSLAMSADCDRAEPLLRSVLMRAAARDTVDARATLALGVCLIRAQRYAEGRALVGPLSALSDRQMAADASLWAAVASTVLGEPDSAGAYMPGASRSRVEWLLSRIYLDHAQWASAESLLQRRAARGDFRADVPESLRMLWQAGRSPAVERIVAAYDSAHTPAGPLAALHMLTGEMALQSSDDSIALAHFVAAGQLTRDSIVARNARAEVTLLSLRELASLVDVRTAIEQGADRMQGSSLHQRLAHNLLLLELLHARDDDPGAGLFLAAEVARDSLRAYALSRGFFQQVMRHARSPLAPRALRAAEALPQDPTPVEAAALVGDTDHSIVTTAAFGDVDAGDSAGSALGSEAHVDSLLEQTWRAVLAQYTDSLRRSSEVPVPQARDSGPAPRDSLRP